MALNLAKNGVIDLNKYAPALTNAVVGLGWHARETDGVKFDLDASAMLVGRDGNATCDEDFVFYNNTRHPSGAVIHSGDDRSGGDGESDDEQIEMHLNDIPKNITAIHIIVSIDRAEQRNQSFADVSRSYIRIFDADNPNDENSQFRYDLTNEGGYATVMQFGVLERGDAGWRFHADTRSFSSLVDAIGFFGLSA